ncbi:MAG TPA: fructose-bisphosphate aldolase [Actinobacteria bacterium]|nr:fructose-bisphosphate aldolase [Actinomycetes bacterium]HEX21752.1 fructose-bisphosphate aldolase [Actinomycetota bacterium]
MLKTINRVKLDDLDINTGKKVRLHRLLYEHGPANGTVMLLPIDQGLEHGPIDFFPNPDSVDPEYQFRIALEGSFSGIALHIGLAEKYFRRYAGRVPLVLKLNGKTNIPSDAQAFSPQVAGVEDAVRLGADAVGYTLYVGSVAQDEDFIQLMSIRQEAERFGMPLIIWSYPRGEAVENKGGRDSLYAVDYAARVASEVGADIIKLNFPKLNTPKAANSPAPYNDLKISLPDAVAKIVSSAGKAMVIFAGGSKLSDEDLLNKVRIAMEAGGTGLIFGRNMWQRPHENAMVISKKIHGILNEFSG